MASISIFKSIEFIFTFKPIVMQTTIMLCCGIILIGLNSHKQWRRKIIFMHNCCGHMNSLAVCIFIPSVHIEQSTAKYRWCGDHVDHVTVCPYIFLSFYSDEYMPVLCLYIHKPSTLLPVHREPLAIALVTVRLPLSASRFKYKFMCKIFLKLFDK